MKYLKYLPWLICIIAVGVVAFYQYQAASSAQELLDQKNKQLQKANLELGRAKTTLVKQKDLHRSAMQKIEKKWQEEITKRKALVTQYTQLEGKYETSQHQVKTVSHALWKEKQTQHRINLPEGKLFVKQANGQYKQIDSIEWNYRDFRISIQGDALKSTLSYQLHQRFKGKLVETKLPTGGYNHYAKIYELGEDNKILGELELTQFNVFKKTQSISRMFWWNPKIDLSVAGTISTALQGGLLADIGISLSGYGKTVNDLTWRFFRIGAGISNSSFSLSISPVQYNVASVLPLVSNLWISPVIGYQLNQLTPFFGAGISVVF